MKVKAAVLFLSLIFSGTLALAQQNRLFTYNGEHRGEARDMVLRGSKLILNREVLEKLYRDQLPNVKIEISLANEILTLDLKKTNLFSENFETIAASTLEKFDYHPGYYLQGTISGKEQSLAAISIFENSAGGVLSFNGDNYNLCIANNFTDYNTLDYFLYADKDCTLPKPVCEVKDEPGLPEPLSLLSGNRQTAFIGCPVDIHFEAAYKMYQTQGNSITNVMNYLTTVFNSVQTLYSNENILVQIREVIVWDVPDPENALTTSGTVLSAFRTRMTPGFNGDLAHYVTYANLGGGVAYLDILCSSPGLRTAVSGNMAANYAAFPNFSFTVEVITHETGHNLSSRHTQNCSWPGGAIDNCYTTEGGCPPGPAPVGGGTIMSYCHLAPYGINFANGFGILPGNKVRNGVTVASNAGCLCNCTNIELNITKTDIGCGSPTGTATAVITGGTGPFTYAWSNGATTATVSGLAAGTYYVKVTGSTANCTVIRGFKILSAGGTTVPVTINPAATNVAKCFGETYNITASTTAPGTVNYQWYQNGIAIPTATAAVYDVTTAGNYYVRVTAGTCTGQSSTVAVTYQNVAAPVITVNGPSAICANDSVRLTIPATSFSIEWQLNGMPLAGANTSTFFAKLPGNYTARLYSASNPACTATSLPVAITVNPIPNAATAPAGNVNICTGGSVAITHMPVPGETYQWYNSATIIAGATNNLYNASANGSYTLRITSANGCKNTSSATNVTVNALPDSAITPNTSQQLCNGGSIQLMVTSTPGVTYTWYNNSTIVSSGALNTFNVTAGGNYSALITNPATNCYSTSDAVAVTIILPPVIFAGTDTVLATGQPYQLRAYERSNLGVNQYAWSPSTGLSNPFISNPVTTLQRDQQYIVTGTNPLGCTGRDTIKIKVYNGPAIYVASAFSPNGDGNNDVLKCFAVGLSSFKQFIIYNRYGEKMFSTTNVLNGWNGKRGSSLAAAGTYVWIAEATDHKGLPMVKRGSFILVR